MSAIINNALIKESVVFLLLKMKILKVVNSIRKILFTAEDIIGGSL